ncbi:recombinase RecT [Brucella anthropi]|uniref:recombinase RecT n=1 Tax=Brucella anthropi TaxID=529 RepID=UPI00124C64C3|nr:recombinase RecT [Brucella anthropi]KAB2792565.1 recombinase RecT [Brucella anthropi]
MNAIAKTEKTTTPAEDFRNQWTKQENEVAGALPPHIPVERFMRVVMTAVGGNADLMNADRRSLFESAMKAAQDGLLPDGRDGALVIFNAKVKEDNKDVWIKKVQWMPMVGGILKKIRNSGELLSLSAYVVYENDDFQYTLGDEETIVHRPCLDSNRGDAKLVYAIAKTKDGGIYREIMTLKDVEKVRAVSKTGKFGPWADWWDEMAKKTVIRRLAKRLPMSSDLDDLIRRDDELYDFSGRRSDVDAQQNRLQARGSLSQLLRGGNETAQIGQQAKEGFQIEHQPEEPETPASEPDAGEQGVSEEVEQDQAPRLSDEDRAALKNFIKQCIAGVGTDPSVIVNTAKGHADTFTSQLAKDKAGTIARSFTSVCRNEADLDAAITYTCGIVGIDPAEVDEVE